MYLGTRTNDVTSQNNQAHPVVVLVSLFVCALIDIQIKLFFSGSMFYMTIVSFVRINALYASELHCDYYEQRECNKGSVIINETAGVILSCHSLLNWM